MVLYQYLLAKGGERLRPDASAKVFYLAIALTFIVFGTYASETLTFGSAGRIGTSQPSLDCHDGGRYRGKADKGPSGA